MMGGARSRRGAGGWGLVAAGISLAGPMLVGCGPGGGVTDRTGEPDRLSLNETLAGADTVGYRRATGPIDFEFPRDHGPHPDFRTEWWYVTGNMTTLEDGRRFGFQWTLFRSALAPEARTELEETVTELAQPSSAWTTRQAYMGHFALTDVTEQGFHAAERFARGSAGLAGATAEPFRVWLGDWELASLQSESFFPLRLRAQQDGTEIDLNLEGLKPMVLQGDRGWSPKGPEPGNASHYYSFTRMPLTGRVVVDGDTLSVQGAAWLDREWSTSALSEGVVGWDWFALQLNDGWDVMVYQLRDAAGAPTPFSDGVLITPEGQRVELAWGEDLLLEPLGSWSSPVDGATYPSRWRLRVPERGWDLTVEPVVDDQELDLSFRYWEGAVDVQGTGEGGGEVGGVGYVEMTGYAGEVPGR